MGSWKIFQDKLLRNDVSLSQGRSQGTQHASNDNNMEIISMIALADGECRKTVTLKLAKS